MFRSVLRTSTNQLVSTARPVAVRGVRGYAAHSTPQPFDWEDPLDYKSLLTEEELAIQETAEAYCQERMLPRVLGKFNCQLSRSGD
jgi:glutaryl-CoA dehydrogenase